MQIDPAAVSSTSNPIINMASSSSPPPQSQQKGVAGRINYAAWDKVATDLVEQVEREDEEDTAVEKSKVRILYIEKKNESV